MGLTLYECPKELPFELKSILEADSLIVNETKRLTHTVIQGKDPFSYLVSDSSTNIKIGGGTDPDGFVGLMIITRFSLRPKTARSRRELRERVGSILVKNGGKLWEPEEQNKSW